MKHSEQKHYIGVDICKAKLDLASPGHGLVKSLKNTPKGIGELFKLLEPLSGTVHLVCEPTGGYEKLLLAAAFERGVAISMVNALRVRSFAVAQGRLAKTDEIDAGVIAEFGRIFQPHPAKRPCKRRLALSAVVRHREGLVRQLAREKTILQKTTESFVKQELRASMGFLTRHIAKCEGRLDSLIRADDKLQAKRERIEQVKGVGSTTSTLMIAELPELGTLTNAQIASLVGVAPMNNDSGSRRGQRTIRAGRARVRRGLFMPALCAIRHNPILREFYQGLIARHKPAHVALTAVMRKLVCLLNRLLADPEFKLHPDGCSHQVAEQS